MYEETLVGAGMKKDEAALYAVLLEHGPLNIAEAARRASLHRPAAYKALSSLLSRGLAKAAVVGKRKAYAAASLSMVEKLMDDRYAQAKESMKELAERARPVSGKPKVTYGTGRQAILDTFSDVVHGLKRGDTYYRYSSSSMLDRKHERYVPKDYRPTRDRKGLERYVITNVPTKKEHALRLGREVKAVPPEFDLFEYNVSQILYGNKMAIIDYNTETAIVIENPVIAEFQKKIFKLLYKKL